MLVFFFNTVSWEAPEDFTSFYVPALSCRGVVSTEIGRKLSVRVLGTSAGDVKTEVEEQLGSGEGTWGQWVFIALAAVNVFGHFGIRQN